MKIRSWIAFLTGLAIVVVLLKDLPMASLKASTDVCLSNDGDGEADAIKNIAAAVPVATAAPLPGGFLPLSLQPQQACEPTRPRHARSGPRAPPFSA